MNVKYFVGLDLNTAPIHLLRHVSGISEAVAKNIVQVLNQVSSVAVKWLPQRASNNLSFLQL